MRLLRGWLLGIVLSGIGGPIAHGWDYEGHRMVNQLALAAMPADFAPFTREPAAAERIAFLAGEPDRWRNVTDHPVKHYASLDHYFDYEQLAMAGMTSESVPEMRYDFVAKFAAARVTHAAAFPVIDPAKNADHTSEWPGFAPWAITEYYGKLKSAFTYLKTFQELGTPEEIANAQANTIYLMGVMGHYVGDCSQPLHLTIHHNGWEGDNPHGYTRWPKFHAWIDGGFIGKAGIKTADVLAKVVPADQIQLPANGTGRDPMFTYVMSYITAQHQFVEPLYVLDKAGAFREENIGQSNAGRDFIEARLLTGGKTLAAIWLTAWRSTGPDDYLRERLMERRKATPPPAIPTQGQ